MNDTPHQTAAPEDRDGSCGDCGHGSGSNREEALSLALAGLLVAGSLIAGWTDAGPHAASAVLAAAAMASGGWFLLPKAWRSVRRLRADINVLVVVAAVGASLIGEWTEAATVIVLFGVAEWLEGWADRRSHRAVETLLKIAPKTAEVRRGGSFTNVPVEQVQVGEIVAVKTGMSIPLDGEVVQGQSSVNQAPITGESVPVEIRPGDTVFAGTINGEGALEVQVTKPAGDSTLARIIRLVEEAQEKKAPTQRFVDVFAKYYTPSVTALAVLVFVVPPLFLGGEWSDWLYRACVLLIIACPCALVISTPVSIVAGLTALARRGVLVKGGAHLEAVATLRALAVDKTGTITEGRPRVQAVEAFAPATDTDVLRIAAAIDSHSPHPLARAVVQYATDRGVEFSRADQYRARSGRGAEGTVSGRRCFVGNHRFAREMGVCSAGVERHLAEIEARGQSVVAVGVQSNDGRAGEVLGIIAVGDSVRANAAGAIRALHKAGVTTITMLSGDNARAAAHIAKQVGIDEVRGDLLPHDKVQAVTALRETYGSVGMVGDGVNDAPAMAAATVGIAMGAAGTDAAIETADIALMQDDLAKIAETVRLGRRTLGIIRFNIAFSLALKIVFLVATFVGYASLWLAILADTGATLLVVANALRLLKGVERAASPQTD